MALLRGLAVPYGRPIVLVEGEAVRVVEQVRAGALRFDGGVRLSLGHTDDTVLASTHGGTLRLEDGPDGLGFEADLPDTETGRHVAALVGRGDLYGVSIGWRLDTARYDRRRMGRSVFQELVSADVYDVALAGGDAAYAPPLTRVELVP